MKAVLVRAFSPYDQAEFGELDDPVPNQNEVVVDLRASDVNYPDILYIEGKYQAKLQFPFSPGLGGAGRIAAIGAGVTDLSVGQRVLVLPQHGTYSEKVRAPSGYCFPMPANMPYAVAAALGLVYQSAHFALVERAALKRGASVLVLGATGGIAMASIQLAKALGAGMVIAATRSEEGARFAREIGADETVNAAMDNLRDGLRDAVKSVTGGLGVDIVIDPVGGDLSAAALRALAWCGRLVVVGFVSGEIPQIPANYLLVKNISVCGLQWTDYRARALDRCHAAQRKMFDLWEQQHLKPVISRSLPLARFRDALADIKNRRAQGKVVLLTTERDD
jgi:NADPH2:quinone reductase